MVAQGLRDQLILPGGSSSLRFNEVARKPASVLLAEGDLPPEATHDPITVKAVRELDLVEAASIIEQEDSRRVLPKVPLDAAGVMRTRHHAIARMLAAGAKHAEVARAVGTTPTSVSLLLRSPAFQSLLLEYMAMMDKAAVDSRAKLEVLNSLGIDELITRLASPAVAEKLKTSEVLEIVKTASDRTGLGPTTKTVSLNGRISPADIRALKDAQVVLEAEPSEWVDAGGDDTSAELCGGPSEPGEPGEEAGEGAGNASRRGLSTDDDLTDLVAALDKIL